MFAGAANKDIKQRTGHNEELKEPMANPATHFFVTPHPYLNKEAYGFHFVRVLNPPKPRGLSIKAKLFKFVKDQDLC